MSGSKRWVNRPEGSTWGDFGPDDQRGRINLLTPAKLKQGIAEVKEFQPFCLSLPLDLPIHAGFRPLFVQHCVVIVRT